jgi:hypothetical protein
MSKTECKEVKSVDCRWYSRWSLSLGLKKEFMKKLAGEVGDLGLGPLAPFLDDENLHFFPWTKRARPSQARKLGLILPPASSRGVSFYTEFFKKKKEQDEKEKSVMTNLRHSKPGDASRKSFIDSKLADWTYFSSSDDEETDRQKEEENKTTDKNVKTDHVQTGSTIMAETRKIKALTALKQYCPTQEELNPRFPENRRFRGKRDRSVKFQPTFMNPVESFSPGEGLVIGIYRLDYPTIVTPAMIEDGIKMEAEALKGNFFSSEKADRRPVNK